MAGLEMAKAGAEVRTDVASDGQPLRGQLKRKLKNRGKVILRQLFELGQRAGFDILPRHFYSEIPDIRQLRQQQQWRVAFDMAAIRGGLDQQVEFIKECTAPYVARLRERQVLKSSLQMNGSDEGYGEVEAEFLYCFVRQKRPKTIIQVGCGVSTAVCLLAARDEQYKPRIVCIEPYPTEFLKSAHKAGEIELVQKKVQEVELDYFRQIGAGDLFFVDSSHTLGPCGEVSRIVLSILPRIGAGAFVHFHDIWFPYDYCPHVLTSDLFFLHETPLLYAFLCMNERFSIAASLCQVFHARKEELQERFPWMVPAEFVDGLMVKPGHHPSSIYLRS